MKVTILGRSDIQRVIEMRKVIEGVREVYKLKSLGKSIVWPLVSYNFTDENGVMDIRSGYVSGVNVHGLKMLNSFPNNAGKGFPTFNGLLMIFDSTTGIPIGILDAAFITCMRTGAAGALAASVLARKDSRTLFVLGAGRQAFYQIAASLLLMPQLKKIYISDPLSAENARNFAAYCADRLERELAIRPSADTRFEAVEDMAASVGSSDIVITVTPSRKPVIQKEWVRPGTHFSCIGADMEGKEEIDPDIFAGARIFADDKAQCMRVGEMEIPLKKRVISEDDIAGEIGDVLIGKIPGRKSKTQTTIFDATGLAPLDLVTAKIAVESAHEKGLGTAVDIS